MDNSNNTVNTTNTIDEFIFNISGIKEEYFTNFFKDIVNQNWGVKIEDVLDNDNMKVYMGYFTDEINEIIDQYDNILLENTIIENNDENNNQIPNNVPSYNNYEEDDYYNKKFKNLKEINKKFGKSKKLSKKDKFLEEGNHCYICLEKFKPRELKRELSCKHHFHQKCIDKWLKIDARCPICREKFL